MSVESYSSSLQYPDLKKRAVSSRSFRTKISPTNSTTFTQGQTISINLAGNLPGQFYNFNQMYLKMTVQGTEAFYLDRAGALGFIKRLQISTAGTQISDLNNYNVLATGMMDLDSSAEWKGSNGAILLGTQADILRGEHVPATTPRTYCIPLVLNPLAMTSPHRMIPAFSQSAIKLDITLDNTATSVFTTGTVPVLSFTEVELCCMMTELSPAAMQELNTRCGGQYNILCNNYVHSGSTVQAAATAHTCNLGFSMSSLERIMLVQRIQAHTTNISKYSLGSRCTGNLTELQFLVNNETYPQRPLLVQDQGAESMGELLISNHSLTDFKNGSGLQNSYTGSAADTSLGQGTGPFASCCPNLNKVSAFNRVGAVADGNEVGVCGLGTGAANGGVAAGLQNAAASSSNIGTFLTAVEFESGLSVGASSHIYSGVSTIASNVQAKLTYAGGGGVPAGGLDLDFFALHTIILSLDMNSTGTWMVSV